MKDWGIICLCGGEGRRARPISKILPKFLFPTMDGRPIIEHYLNHWSEIAKEYIFVIDPQSFVILSHYLSSIFPNRDIDYIFILETIMNGTYKAVHRAYMRTTADYIIFAHPDIYHFWQPEGMMGDVIVVEGKHREGYGVFIDDRYEKAQYVSIGTFAFRREVLSHFYAETEDKVGENAGFEEIFFEWVRHTEYKIDYVAYEGEWYDFGNLNRYCQYLLQMEGKA